ncbi:MAG TPA: LysR substrate-binding domain-containing protein [Pelagibacterium sp.]|uniref:LysR substrate-binding domain-containing protein n=1 Tax=Pelagibacterium sp. TaxID=1967288 RepID=UPI002B5DCD2E|nr:LysR substrate-binding domain-containing protein [Pelagibacterium sp.]HWJ87108.1 LysR substrate-binding domain-containing protein [Pelagibacterium sp.]
MHNPKAGRILAALPVFDACIRAGSFTRAAQRLDVTQSAVTRRIQALEADLGVALFRREGRALKPTEDGMALWTYAVETLNDLDVATAGLGLGSEGVLRVGVLPSLGALWLIPRLDGFLAANSGTSVEMVTIDADFGTERKDPITWDPAALDVVVTWGRGGWKPLAAHRLFDETMHVVASPGLIERHGLDGPAALARAPRLVHTTRPRAWADWAHKLGLAIDMADARTLSFEHFFMVLEAARAGLGVALLPGFLIGSDLASGALVPIPGSQWRTGASYWCVANPPARITPRAQAFVRFLGGLGAGAGMV